MCRSRLIRFHPSLKPLEARDLPSFLPPFNYPIPSTIYGRVVIDINGDRQADVVAAAYSLNSVAFFRGDGTGRLVAPVLHPVGNEPADLRVGDINGDGKPDVVTLNGTFSSNPTITVLLGNGAGAFEPPITFPATAGSTHIAVGDLNRDNRLDLATSTGSKDVVSVFTGNGDGTFQLPISFATGPGAWGIQIVDLNGDAWPDITTVNPSAGKIHVLLNRGDGLFKSPQAYAAGTYPFVHDVGDINADGRPDVVVADFYGHTVNVFYTRSDGTLEPMIALPSGPNPFDPRLGDFNRDGRVDIAAAQYGNSAVAVFLGKGDGSFGLHTEYGVGKADFRALAVGDLNNDRFTDVVVPTGHGAGGFLNVLRNDKLWAPPAPIPPLGLVDNGGAERRAIPAIAQARTNADVNFRDDNANPRPNAAGDSVAVPRRSGARLVLSAGARRGSPDPAVLITADLNIDDTNWRI